MNAPFIIALAPVKSEDFDMESPAPSRKRRLDHLSWEEKMQRKKMKNRVAAQTSRDRKKAKMDEMESRIAQLERANITLSGDVKSLKALNERLSSENEQLRREAAARRVGGAGATGPAEGGPGGVGESRGAPHPGHVPDLGDVIDQLNSDEYLDTLQQLAESLLREIDAENEGKREDPQHGDSGQCAEGGQVVGAAPEQLEPCRSTFIDARHDIQRILMQHSYAHPCPRIQVTPPQQAPNDKGDFFVEEESDDCVTVTVDDEVIDEKDTEQENDDLSLHLDMELPMLLSPLSACTPSPVGKDFDPSLSPAHSFSDLGYESMSPFSEHGQMDLPDFWCETLSELFPDLA